MKKNLLIMMMVLLVFSLIACSDKESATTEENDSNMVEENEKEEKQESEKADATDEKKESDAVDENNNSLSGLDVLKSLELVEHENISYDIRVEEIEGSESLYKMPNRCRYDFKHEGKNKSFIEFTDEKKVMVVDYDSKSVMDQGYYSSVYDTQMVKRKTIKDILEGNIEDVKNLFVEKTEFNGEPVIHVGFDFYDDDNGSCEIWYSEKYGMPLKYREGMVELKKVEESRSFGFTAGRYYFYENINIGGVTEEDFKLPEF